MAISRQTMKPLNVCGYLVEPIHTPKSVTIQCMRTHTITETKKRWIVIFVKVNLLIIVITANAPYTQYQPPYKNPFPYFLKTVWCNTMSEMNNINNGKTNAFHLLLK